MKPLPEELQAGRGPDWPFDVEKLQPGDSCEFRFPARQDWHKAVVIKNGMESYWTVQSVETSADTTEGQIVSSLWIEHIRAPQKKE